MTGRKVIKMRLGCRTMDWDVLQEWFQARESNEQERCCEWELGEARQAQVKDHLVL
jgi:hypothetical protein